MIQIDSVSVAMGKHTILHRISAELPAGVSCIIGPNGSGKTMLLRTVAGLLNPSEGHVFLNGENIHRMDRAQRARKIAYLPQVRPIPQIEVVRLVEHGRHPYSGFANRIDAEGRAAVEHAMTLTNVSHLAEKKLTQLSGGERQRVYIAAALAQDTDVLLLDEPTTYLDLNSQLELLRFVRDIAQKRKSIIMVMHDIVQAFHVADHLLLLKQGKVLACDAPNALLGKEVLHELCGYYVVGDPAPDMVYQYRLSNG